VGDKGRELEEKRAPSTGKFVGDRNRALIGGSRGLSGDFLRKVIIQTQWC
jgi:hypothetical protein